MFRNEHFRLRARELQTALDISDGEAKEELVVIFAKAANVRKTQLLTEPHRFMGPSQIERFESLFSRRLAGEPLPYITGEVGFYGSRFSINSDVLVPRPDTETLIDALLVRADDAGGKRLLELGVGSGILSIVVVQNIPDLDVVATDISLEAINVARKNAADLLSSVEAIGFLCGDWFEPVSGRFDFIISNPPYVAEGDVHLNHTSMNFEPRVALTSGSDGLRDLSIIIRKSPEHLNPGGWLIVEHGFDQSIRVKALMRAAGFKEVFTDKDLGGRPRVTGGRISD